MGLTTSQPQAILCLDIDGTLLDSDEQVHPNDVRILRHFPSEIQLILTTGRPMHSAKPTLQMNGIFQEQKLPIPGVYMNGGVAYFPNEELWFEHPLSRKTSLSLLDLSKAYLNSEFMFCTESEIYRVNRTDLGAMICHNHHFNVIEDIDNDIFGNIIKVMVFNSDPSELDLIRQASGGLDAEMAISLPFIFEFNPPNVTKGTTLSLLLKELDLENCPIFAAGDGENDLSLFKLAKRSFAPDTARPTVLARADQIIPRNKNGLLLPILDQIQSYLAKDDYPKRPEM